MPFDLAQSHDLLTLICSCLLRQPHLVFSTPFEILRNNQNMISLTYEIHKRFIFIQKGLNSTKTVLVRAYTLTQDYFAQFLAFL